MPLNATMLDRDMGAMAADLPQTLQILRHASLAAYSVADALVGEIVRAEKGDIDGIMGEDTCRIVLRVASCSYQPVVGQRVMSGTRTMRIKSVTDDPTATAYILDCEAV